VVVREGSKSWRGPLSCHEHNRLPGCEVDGDHLHCDGPRSGEYVEFKTISYQKSHNDPLFSDDRPVRRGTGEVVCHWHYESCMIDVMFEGVRYTVCPSLGDDCKIVARPCIAARERTDA
jgi:hypothetical protein